LRRRKGGRGAANYFLKGKKGKSLIVREKKRKKDSAPLEFEEKRSKKFPNVWWDIKKKVKKRGEKDDQKKKESYRGSMRKVASRRNGRERGQRHPRPSSIGQRDKNSVALREKRGALDKVWEGGVSAVYAV